MLNLDNLINCFKKLNNFNLSIKQSLCPEATKSKTFSVTCYQMIVSSNLVIVSQYIIRLELLYQLLIYQSTSFSEKS